MNERIKVVLLEPDKEAQIAEIETTLESMQHLVGDGFIEAFYPFEEEVCIVCNDEGKINGLPLNRAVYSENGELMDIIAGTCFLCCQRRDKNDVNRRSENDRNAEIVSPR